MPWDANQWATWRGDRKALSAALEAAGYKIVGWINGKPNIINDIVDWEAVERTALDPEAKLGVAMIPKSRPRVDLITPARRGRPRKVRNIG